MAAQTKEARTILIVEDEGMIQQVLAMRLKVNHFRVLLASDGEEGLAVIRKDRPDLIVLDLMLPKVNGYELCRMVKFDDALKSIPVIILSALERSVDRERASEAGADAYFIKPFDLSLLVVKINELLKASHRPA